MDFNLSKGERFNLTKETGGKTNFYIGVEWDTPKQAGGHDFDLDTSIFGCAIDANDDPKLFREDYFVYYGRAASPGAPFFSEDGAIHHSGDNRTGAGDGDDEQVRIYLDKIDPRTEEIAIVVTLHDAAIRGQNFGQVRKAKVRICEMDDSGNPTTELRRFELTEDYSAFTALVFGQIYKRGDGDWAFNAVGQGIPNGTLQQIVENYKN